MVRGGHVQVGSADLVWSAMAISAEEATEPIERKVLNRPGPVPTRSAAACPQRVVWLALTVAPRVTPSCGVMTTGCSWSTSTQNFAGRGGSALAP